MSVADVLNNRRTIRKYSDKVVDDELLTKLLTMAGRTSTCGNMQLYSVVVTHDADVKAKLVLLILPSLPAQGSVLLTFCADYHRFDKWCEQNKAVPGYNNIESLSARLSIPSLWPQSFSLLAEEQGLGICYLGTTTYNPKPIAEALDLPEMVVPLVTLSLGYPDESPALVDRISSDGWIHKDTYHDYSAADIDRIYGYKESLPENVEFLKINKNRPWPQIFTDIRYTKKDGDFFSKAFIDFLKEQGFLAK